MAMAALPLVSSSKDGNVWEAMFGHLIFVKSFVETLFSTTILTLPSVTMATSTQQTVAMKNAGLKQASPATMFSDQGQLVMKLVAMGSCLATMSVMTVITKTETAVTQTVGLKIAGLVILLKLLLSASFLTTSEST